MGNQLAQPQKVQPDHLAEIPNVVLKEHLGGGRFLKTVLCVHDEGGQVVVKVYSKRGDVDIDKYAQQLLHIRSRLSGLPGSHVWPFQRFFHTDKAAYLIRQHIFSNLYHRLSTRPFLASVEKHWIAFQLLQAVVQAHEQGICHGDIKCENVLVTSWHWIFLADFASYKPTYLPADNPADFSFFFDTGGRRRCYIAPERFYTADAVNTASLSNAPIRPAMDIFSLGCVIAELFLEGQRLFDLSELLAYKRGEHSPEATLAKVEEPFRQLVLHMINVDPSARLSAAEYLQTWGPSLFPFYFGSLLHPIFCSLLPMEPDSRIRAIQKDFHILVETIMGKDAAARLRRKPLVAPRTVGVPGGGAEAEAEDGGQRIFRQAGSATVQELRQDTSGLLAALDRSVQAAERPPAALAEAPRGVGDAPASVQSGRTVIIEEALEFQCRDRGRAFGEASTSGRVAAHKEWNPPAARRKEDVALPAEPGWQWTDEWRIDRESSPTDSRGWAYLASGSGPDSLQWSSNCKLDCLWRRRRWTRQRRKLQPYSRLALQELGRSLQEAGDAQGMVIVATLLCSTMRGARLQECKAQAIALLTETAGFCDDDTRLQRIVPYLMECMKVPMASVRCAALQGLVSVLALTESLPPSDAKVFAEYILPSLSLVPNDKEEWMRVAYAAAIGPLAQSAQRLLDHLHGQGASSPATARCEAEVQELRAAVERVVTEVVLGARSTAGTRRALLTTLVDLAGFLGRRESNDFLLPILMTFLNSPDWQLRSDFFASAANLRHFAGTAGVEAYLLPCLLQALGDRQHEVVARAVGFLAALTEAGHLRRRSLLAVLSAAKGHQVLPALLHHESAGVRAAAALFAAAVAKQLSPAEAYTFLRPRLLPALGREPADLQEAAVIVECLPERGAGSARPAAAQEGSKPRGSEVENGAAGRHEAPSLLIPASAPVYSIKLRQPLTRPDASALESALASAAAVAEGAVGEEAAHMSARRLLPDARRLPRATAEMASMHGRLASGLQIGGDEALSFQVDAMRTPPASVSASVSSAMDAAIHTHLPTHTPASSLAPWRPRGLMVMHLAEHRKAVNRLAIAGSGAFLASASSDETVKIWDCRRLERDVTFRSRLTYTAQSGSILACADVGDGQTIASGSSNGSLHVWRVEYTTRPGGNPDHYTGLVGMRQESPDEGAILEIVRWGSLLLYSSQAGRLHAVDLRAKGDAWVLRLDASQGCWPALAADCEGSNWLVCGSSRGQLALWDMRFQVCIKSWQHADKLPIRALTPALAPPRRLGLLRLGATCPLIYASAGPNEVGVWDVEQARCHQVLQVQPLTGNRAGSRPLTPGAAPGGAGGASDQFAAAELQLHDEGALEGTQALLPTAAGPLLTGSNDGCIRCWDAAHIDQSYIVSGPPHALDKGAPAVARMGVSYGQRLAGGVHVIEEVPITQSAARRTDEPSAAGSPEERRAAISHADAVLHLVELHSLGDRLLMSAGADGVVKAWK